MTANKTILEYLGITENDLEKDNSDIDYEKLFLKAIKYIKNKPQN